MARTTVPPIPDERVASQVVTAARHAVPATRRVGQLDPTNAAPTNPEPTVHPTVTGRVATATVHPPGQRVTVNGPREAGERVAAAGRTDPATT